jgi:ribosome-associated protein
VTDRPDEPDEAEQESRRSASRRARREAGVDSAQLAHALMKLPASALPKLGLDEDLRETVERARKVTSLIARRRAERSLAGALRRVNLVTLATRIENVRATGLGDPRRLHEAERWRTRLIEEEGSAAAFHAAFPDADHSGLSQQIADARRERNGGKPPGAGRALFRRISFTLGADATAKEAAAEAAAEAAEQAAEDRSAENDDADGS